MGDGLRGTAHRKLATRPRAADPVSAKSDAELLAASLDGSEWAFGALVARHGALIRARLRRSVPAREDVEDLTQDVLLSAWRGLAGLREPERFAAWLGRIADNAARMWQRRRFRQLSFAALLDGDATIARADTASRAAAAQADTRRRRAIIRGALPALPAAQRDVVIHHYFRGYSYRETAELLGIEVRTVRSRLQKARSRLKEEISMSDPAPAPRSVELDAAGLDALRLARAFTSRDPERGVLRGICLDPTGRVVATDAHRLLLARVGGLDAVGAPVILGPWGDVPLPESGGATLEIGATAATLRTSSGAVLALDVLEGPFPAWERVVDPPLRARAVLSSDALLELLSLAGELAPSGRPVEPTERERLRRLVELRLSAADAELGVSTSRRLGHVLGEDTPPGPGWSFQARCPAEVDMSGDDVLRAGIDARYLREAVLALDVEGDDPVELRFGGPTDPVGCRANASTREVWTMPMRVPAANAASA